MRLDTTLTWNIACPKCRAETLYKTDMVYARDEHLDLVFDCVCACGHRFGYVQTYTNDPDRDETVSVDEMRDLGYTE